MPKSCWTKVLNNRVSRRRAIAGTSAVAGAAAWPALGNYQVYRSRFAAASTHYGTWLDDTKAPFA